MFPAFDLSFQKMGSKIFGSGILTGKMLLIRIIENNKINAYFRSVKIK